MINKLISENKENRVEKNAIIIVVYYLLAVGVTYICTSRLLTKKS